MDGPSAADEVREQEKPSRGVLAAAEGRMLKSPNLNIKVDLLLNGCHVKDFEASESTRC